jgi:hypothetical protein
MSCPLSPVRLSVLAGVLASALAAPPAARAGEFYYLIVFGSQRPSGRPKYTHTFATFVKATGEGPCADAYRLECCTISWLPATGRVSLWRLGSEAGVNFDLYGTLRLLASQKQRVSMWGPFRIDRELYDRACVQAARLQAGGMRYKAIDLGLRTWRASNCIHAVSDMDDDAWLLYAGPTRRGAGAGPAVLDHLRRWLIEPSRTHPWVADRLGLLPCPVAREVCR